MFFSMRIKNEKLLKVCFFVVIIFLTLILGGNMVHAVVKDIDIPDEVDDTYCFKTYTKDTTLGAYVAEGRVHIAKDQTVTFSNASHLIFKDGLFIDPGCTLTINLNGGDVEFRGSERPGEGPGGSTVHAAGIGVPEGATLIIQNINKGEYQGTLVAVGSGAINESKDACGTGAGIGGYGYGYNSEKKEDLKINGDYKDCGTVIIRSGTVYACGGCVLDGSTKYSARGTGAGIGGGGVFRKDMGGDGGSIHSGNGGTVKIFGGTVYAFGGGAVDIEDGGNIYTKNESRLWYKMLNDGASTRSDDTFGTGAGIGGGGLYCNNEPTAYIGSELDFQFYGGEVYAYAGRGSEDAHVWGSGAAIGSGGGCAADKDMDENSKVKFYGTPKITTSTSAAESGSKYYLLQGNVGESGKGAGQKYGYGGWSYNESGSNKDGNSKITNANIHVPWTKSYSPYPGNFPSIAFEDRAGVDFKVEYAVRNEVDTDSPEIVKGGIYYESLNAAIDAEMERRGEEGALDSDIDAEFDRYNRKIYRDLGNKVYIKVTVTENETDIQTDGWIRGLSGIQRIEGFFNGQNLSAKEKNEIISRSGNVFSSVRKAFDTDKSVWSVGEQTYEEFKNKASSTAGDNGTHALKSCEIYFTVDDTYSRSIEVEDLAGNKSTQEVQVKCFKNAPAEVDFTYPEPVIRLYYAAQETGPWFKTEAELQNSKGSDYTFNEVYVGIVAQSAETYINAITVTSFATDTYTPLVTNHPNTSETNVFRATQCFTKNQKSISIARASAQNTIGTGNLSFAVTLIGQNGNGSGATGIIIIPDPLSDTLEVDVLYGKTSSGPWYETQEELISSYQTNETINSFWLYLVAESLDHELSEVQYLVADGGSVPVNDKLSYEKLGGAKRWEEKIERTKDCISGSKLRAIRVSDRKTVTLEFTTSIIGKKGTTDKYLRKVDDVSKFPKFPFDRLNYVIDYDPPETGGWIQDEVDIRVQAASYEGIGKIVAKHGEETTFTGSKITYNFKMTENGKGKCNIEDPTGRKRLQVDYNVTWIDSKEPVAEILYSTDGINYSTALSEKDTAVWVKITGKDEGESGISYVMIDDEITSGTSAIKKFTETPTQPVKYVIEDVAGRKTEGTFELSNVEEIVYDVAVGASYLDRGKVIVPLIINSGGERLGEVKNENNEVLYTINESTGKYLYIETDSENPTGTLFIYDRAEKDVLRNKLNYRLNQSLIDGQSFVFNIAAGDVEIQNDTVNPTDDIICFGNIVGDATSTIVCPKSQKIILTGSGINTSVVIANTNQREINMNSLSILFDDRVEVDPDAERPYYSPIAILDGANPTLILNGQNELKAFAGIAGINVDEKSSVVIKGGGSVNIFVSGGAAGVGGNLNENAGEITIESGQLNIDLSGNGAGIGSGSGSSTDNICTVKNINIQETYLVTNIKVTATNGAGIGSGFYGKAENITIDGGTIRAIVTGAGAGIGSGKNGTAEDITIKKGNIAVKAYTGAGIGSGLYGDVKDLKILGGKIVAMSESGAGIGSASDGASSAQKITIDDGQIFVTASSHGAGIGSGLEGSVTDIVINGGIIIADVEADGAGIGSGRYATAKSITINGGKITTNSRSGAGIGSGAYGVISENINISDGIIECIAEGCGAGIGTGLGNGTKTNGKVEKIIITGGLIKTYSSGAGAYDLGKGEAGTVSNIYIGKVANLQTYNNKVSPQPVRSESDSGLVYQTKISSNRFLQEENIVSIMLGEDKSRVSTDDRGDIYWWKKDGESVTVWYNGMEFTPLQ